MSKKKKYYVIWKGNKTGIFNSWDECKKHIEHVTGAQYKSFKTLELAQQAFKMGYSAYKKSELNTTSSVGTGITGVGKPNYQSVSVDAACSGNPGIVEYQCVETKTKEQIFHFGPLYESTNNIGEFLGLVHTLAHMKKTNDPRPIYTDSRTAMSWVRNKKYKTTLEQTPVNAKSFELMDRAIVWLKNNSISNKILKWETKAWGEIPADFGRK